MIAIYARVSTEEQARKGYSLSDQVKACREAAGEGEKIREYIDEGISGEVLDRPALTRLRNDVRNGLITKVICLDPDRLSRKLMNQLILSEELEKKVPLIFVNGEYQQTPEGKLFYQMRGAISEFEKAKINERFCRGRREKARQGKVVRDYRIYGYDYDRTTGQLVINTREAEIVRLIFRLFTEESAKVKGINGIANYLNTLGVATKRGAKKWHRQVVRQILMNRTYIGEFYQNRWDTEGMLNNRFLPEDDRIKMKPRPREEWILVSCPSIVDVNTFNLAQELLMQSRRRWTGKPKRSYLLSGLVRCGKCGNTMTGRMVKNWGRESLIYSDRKNTAGTRNSGCGKYLEVNFLNNLVWDAVYRMMTDRLGGLCNKESCCGCPVFDETLKRSNEVQESYIKKRLQEIRLGRLNLIELTASAGNLLDASEREEIRQRLESLVREEQELTDRLKELSDEKAEEPICSRAIQYYLKLHPELITFEDKKALIRYVVKEIIIDDDEIRLIGF